MTVALWIFVVVAAPGLAFVLYELAHVAVSKVHREIAWRRTARSITADRLPIADMEDLS